MNTQRAKNIGSIMTKAMDSFDQSSAEQMQKLQKKVYMAIDKQMKDLNDLNDGTWTLSFKSYGSLENVPHLTKDGATKNYLWSLGQLDVMQRYYVQTMLGIISQAQGMGMKLQYTTNNTAASYN